MPKVGLQNIEVGGNTTFQTWLESHNDLVDLMKTDVVTVSPLSGGDVAVGNATIQGTFTANSVIAVNSVSANSVSSTVTGTNIDILDPVRFVTTTSNVVATFLNSNGARTRYSTPTINWSVGLETGAATAFVISTGAGDPQLRITSGGELTVASVSSSNTITANNMNVSGTLTATNTIVGSIDNAVKLLNPRTIAMSGDVVWNSGNFDGSANVSSTAVIQNNVVTDQKIRQSSGLSIIGRSVSTTGNVADITAASDHQVLRRSGTSVGFGSIALNQSAAVTGILGVVNGGTGGSDAASARLGIGAAAAATEIVAGTGISGGGDLSTNRTISFSGAIATTAVTATTDNDGTIVSGSYTPTPVGGNFKRIVNGGSFNIIAPSAAGDYTLIIQMTNGSGAGTITFTGFNRVAGDILTNTVGHNFFLFITRCNGFVSLTAQALQ